MFHVRRRPADCQPRRRKKKSVGGGGGGPVSAAAVHHAHHHHPPRDTPFLVEVTPDGAVLEGARQLRLTNDVIEVGSGNGMTLQLYGPSIQPRHCVVAPGGTEGVATLTPLHADAELYVNGQRVYHTAVLQHGCLIKFGRVSTFRFVDPAHENRLSRNLSQSQHFDSGSIYDRSPTSPIPDNASGIMSSQSINNHQLDGMHSPSEAGMANSTGNVDFPRAMSPLAHHKMGSQDNFNYGSKSHIDLTDSMSPYNNNNNSLKMDDESPLMSQHFANSKSDLLQDNHFASPYNEHEQQTLSKSGSGSGGLKDNYETTFDLDGNVETKSICSAKSGGSGHEPRSSQQMAPRGQEAILPAVLEFPEVGQQQFLHAVITRLDVNVPAFKLAPVYTLYLCARYRASTHYRPELSPTERAHKLTALLHHVATLIQNVIQERQAEASWQAFWMANGSELLHFLKCDRHIAAFSLQAQEALALAVHGAFANLVGCLQAELAPRLGPFLAPRLGPFLAGERDDEAVSPAVHVLAGAMALLRRCRLNAALTIQLFSHLFHYINAYCYNKLVTTPAMCTARWGTLTASRLSQLAGWAEIQGLELAADCHLARLQQVAHLLQAPKNTPDDIAAITSTCFKLNSVQLHQLMSSFVFENGSPVRPELVELAVQHAMSVADELYKADGREITLEESTDLGVQLLVPGDGYSGDVVRGVPPALQDFIAPLQRARLCRLTMQPHSRGAWTVYMNGYHGGSMSMKPSSQQPVVQVIQLHKNTNGMGLSIVAAKGAGQSRLGIYIKSVVSGGAAAADGRLQAGDQLLSVDGQSLQGITQEKAAEFLVRTGPVVTLEVAKQGAVLHGLATLLQQPSPQTNREEEESIRRHSGTFTNFSPVFLRKTRPESEMVTTYHDSAYAKGLGIPDRHSAYYSQQPGFSASVPNSQSFSYLNEETCSSDDSLNNPSRYVGSIPRLTISLDRENTFYEEESPETPGIDIDCHDDDMPRQITVSNLPVFTFICEDFDDMKAKEEEKRKLENSHREQSVDSSLYSYDSDSCANYSQYSINTETKVENPLPKVEFDVSQNQEMCNSFEKLDINLPEQFNSIEICRCTDDEGEIPFIDDGDLEPLIYEHKSYSEDDICEKAVSKVRQILPAVSIEKPDEEPVFKDVATNVTPDSLTLAESEAKPTNSNGQDHFLGEAPKDQNFFSDDSSKRGPTNDKTYNGKITYEKGTKEYVIGPKKGLSLALNQKSETKSSSSREILDSNLNKSWKSPDDIRLGSGKVKALASHFNKMNLQYRAGSYKRNCQSSPNLYHPVINEKKNDAISTSMANLAFLSAPPKLSELEQKKILIQLEDWSRHGTRSSLDSLTIEEQLRSEMPKEIITITQSSSLIFKEIEVTSPSKITLDDIKINWVPHRETDENFTIPKKYGSLEKLTGSLVPRVVEMIPRKAVSSNDIEKSARKPAIEKTKLKIPRRKFPDSYVVKKKTKPRISTKSENTQDSENTLPYPDMSVVQSCPNLLKNTSIRRNNCLIGSNVNHSCPNIVRNRSEHSYMKVCPLGGSKCEAATPRFAWIQYGPVQIGIRSRSVDEISARRASERDLPSRLESESGAMQVKPSKSVPALHEQTRQHEVFNPGYSRTSSNNSIPTMAGLKSRSSHNLSAPLSPGVQPNIHPHAHHHHNQQNAGVEQGFYQNISTYKNPPTQQQQLGDRFSNLRSSQNGLQLQGLQNLPPKQSPMQASPSLQMPPNLGQQHSNTLGPQRPQSAYYQQGQTSTIPPTNGMRSAQSSKDLPGSYDGPNQVRGSYPSMPNVNQGFAPNGPQYHQNHYPSGASSQGNVNYNRPPQHAGQSSFRGQAKLAEMSEEVTRRQQRGPMSPGETQANQNNRFQYSADSYNRLSNGPLSPNAIQNSPTKQQPPVAPKPSGPKRVISGDMAALESDGPPLPPTNTHPQFHTPNTDEDGAYLASALDPPALSVYPAHHSHPHSNQQRAPPGTAPNPWQREEREKEAMARRAAGRARRDAALAALVALGNSRSPLQTQQLRALQLERDFERRAATEMSNDNNEDKEQQDQQGPPLSPMNGGGLLRLANTNNQQHNMNHQMGHMSQSVSMQQLEAAAGINLVPVSSNVVSSIQPVSIVTSNINGGDQQPDSPAGQQTPVPNYPPPPPPTQPKSILKSNLRLENLNSNSPQSPSKSHKNASFSSNLTPQSLKFDQMQPDKYEQSSPNKFEQNMLSKYDPNVPKYAEQQTPTLSKYEQNSYSSSVQNLSKYDPNISVNQLSQNISSLNVSNHERHSGEMEMRYEEQPQGYAPFDPQPALPPQPPERGSSFAVMSQAQQLRSNLLSPNASQALANSLRDKRVSFHDRDQNAASSVEQTDNESNMEIIREDPDRFIAEAENMLQSPTTPTGASATHTPGVIGAQEVYRDPRQRRLLAEQQQKQAQNSPIPEKLTFQEKMKMFALESGENNTPKDKVKISRAQRDIDAVH